MTLTTQFIASPVLNNSEISTFSEVSLERFASTRRCVTNAHVLFTAFDVRSRIDKLQNNIKFKHALCEFFIAKSLPKSFLTSWQVVKSAISLEQNEIAFAIVFCDF